MGQASFSLARWPHAPGALLGVAACVALWLHCLSYLPFFSDDGFISLRYSQRLVEGHGLTWTDGERVEGYSNLLWVLLCAALGCLPMDWVTAARAVGFLSSCGAVAALVVGFPPRTLGQGVALALGCALLVSSPAVAAWTMGGLEQPLVLCLLLWGAVAALRGASARWTTVASLCFGFLCWTRPDGPLWGVSAALLTYWAFPRQGRRAAAWLLATVGLFTAAQLAFRIIYYDDILPNTAYAKLTLTENHRHLGRRYFAESLVPLAGTWLCLAWLAIEAAKRRTLRPTAQLLVGLALPWVGYVVLIGGDIFPNWRHWVPLIGLGALSLCACAQALAHAEHRKRAALFAALVVAASVGGSLRDPADRARRELWEWNAVPLARLLRAQFAEQAPLLAVEAAGSLPFFTRFPALDMLGLNDRYLAHNPPDDFGTGPYGHELGEGAYFLKRAPDLVCFGTPPCALNPKYRGGRQLQASPRFASDYVPVRLRTGGPNAQRGRLWVRRKGRLGIREADGQVHIPAWLFATEATALALPGPGGGLFAELEPGAGATLTDLELAAGIWQLAADEPRGQPIARVSGTELLGAGTLPLRFRLPRAASLEIHLQAGTGPARLAGLVLQRSSDGTPESARSTQRARLEELSVELNRARLHPAGDSGHTEVRNARSP